MASSNYPTPQLNFELLPTVCLGHSPIVTCIWYSDDLNPTSLFVFYLHSPLYTFLPKPARGHRSPSPLYTLVFSLRLSFSYLTIQFRSLNYLCPPIMASYCLYLIQQPHLLLDVCCSSSPTLQCVSLPVCPLLFFSQIGLDPGFEFVQDVWLPVTLQLAFLLEPWVRLRVTHILARLRVVHRV